MEERSTIKINKSVQESFKKFVKKRKVTYSYALDKMCGYFENNTLELEAEIDLSLSNKMDSLERKIVNREDSLRKWFVALKKECIVPMGEKTTAMLELLQQQDKDHTAIESAQAQKIQELEEKIHQNKRDHQALLVEKSNLEQKLQELLSAIELEPATMMKKEKLVLNFSLEKFNLWKQ